MKVCEFPGCEKRHNAKGLCQGHYAQKYREGQELRPLQRRDWAGNKVGYRQHRRALQYGLTLTAISEMLVSQGNCCKLCEKPFVDRNFQIDHDHNCCPGVYACGKCVRGLLCTGCNTSLGQFGDDPDLLLRAANYLLSKTNMIPLV